MSELLSIPNLNAADLRVAGFVFEFVQFLLDDDANLTPAGNLTGAARQRLRTRLEELIAGEEAGGSVLESGEGGLTSATPDTTEAPEGL
jgi:hypothetical protein